MDDFALREKCDFHNLTAPEPKLHLLDEPTGLASAWKKKSLGHQMRYSVNLLEQELVREGRPHVLQLFIEGDERKPDTWILYADGSCVADGDGTYVLECFARAADEFLNVIRNAVLVADLPAIGEEDYRILDTARRIASVEAQRYRYMCTENSTSKYC